HFVVNASALNISATLTITVDNVSPLTTWHLGIANQGQITIESVALPYLSGLGQMSTDPAKDYFTHPSYSGVLFQDPVHNIALNRGWGWQMYYPSGIDNMQFAAYYSAESGAGLYVASQDTAGYTHAVDLARPVDNWLALEHTYVPPFQAGASVTVPYPVVVGVFHGDWYDAASLYRAWAIQQSWAQGGPLATRADVPDWYKKTGMMAWKTTFTAFADDYQSYASIAPVAQAWYEELQSQPLMSWIAWEQGGPWVGSPDFFPPSQGWAQFDSAVSATHAAGGRLMVMPTTNLASVAAPSWTALQATATKQADGSKYLIEIASFDQSYQAFTQTVAQMDPTQPWHDAVVGLTSQLQQHGIDLIHMDGNPFQSVCYATNHAHTPGGGNWWFQDYAQIYRDVRQAGRAVNPDFAMGGEFYAETFIGLTDSGQDEVNTGLDQSNTLNGTIIDPAKFSYIPLWQAVYHDYTLTYSMLSFIDGQYVPYYRRGFAIPLVWGEIPTIFADHGWPAPWQLSGFDATLVRYVQRIVNLRTTYGYPFVVLGRMLRPPQPAVPTYTVPPVNNIPYTSANTSAFNVPSILGSAWQSPQGDAALVFTNISDSDVSFSWTMVAQDVPLIAGAYYDLYILRNGTCASEQKAVSLPYALNLKAASTDVFMAMLSQRAADGTPRFAGCGALPTQGRGGVFERPVVTKPRATQ
ncbi:MAG: DUF6259 domain-containing protein, partial [Bryobacteraceae bacterium]